MPAVRSVPCAWTEEDCKNLLTPSSKSGCCEKHAAALRYRQKHGGAAPSRAKPAALTRVVPSSTRAAAAVPSVGEPDEFERMRRILADLRSLGLRERKYVLERINEDLAEQLRA